MSCGECASRAYRPEAGNLIVLATAAVIARAILPRSLSVSMALGIADNAALARMKSPWLSAVSNINAMSAGVGVMRTGRAVTAAPILALPCLALPHRALPRLARPRRAMPGLVPFANPRLNEAFDLVFGPSNGAAGQLDRAR
jgi:hypothetical protein